MDNPWHDGKTEGVADAAEEEDDAVEAGGGGSGGGMASSIWEG